MDVVALVLGGEGLERPMKPTPGNEMLVPAGIGKEAKMDVEESPIRVETVMRRKESEPSVGSKIKMS